MTDTTIAAGEIRERRGCDWTACDVYPFDAAEGDLPMVWARDLPYVTPMVRVSCNLTLTPAEARDFARAILAAADWAERQGR